MRVLFAASIKMCIVVIKRYDNPKKMYNLEIKKSRELWCVVVRLQRVVKAIFT